MSHVEIIQLLIGQPMCLCPCSLAGRNQVHGFVEEEKASGHSAPTYDQANSTGHFHRLIPVPTTTCNMGIPASVPWKEIEDPGSSPVKSGKSESCIPGAIVPKLNLLSGSHALF